MTIPITIIDIEASGLHFDSYPIEIAVQSPQNNYYWLIKPETNWHYWSETAESLHGISRDRLQEHGVGASQVASELNELFANRNDKLYSDALYWDADWLYTLFKAVGLTQKFQLGSVFDLLSESQQGCFKKQKSAIAASGRYRAHRADEDVKIIHEAFQIAISS